MTSIIIQATGFGIEIRKEKNLHMEGTYFIIEFEDQYQTALIDEYGWSEEQAQNEVKTVLENNFQQSGINCCLIWEDREIFLLQDPKLNIQEISNVLLKTFKGSRVTNEASNSLFLKVLNALRKRK